MKSERKDSKESYIATSRLQKSTLSQGDQDPLVSVVVTVYNLAWCVKETIQSVLQQTYKNVEIIVNGKNVKVQEVIWEEENHFHFMLDELKKRNVIYKMTKKVL